MKLARATEADAPALAALHAESFASPWSAAEISALMQSPGVFGILLRRQGVVAAFALARAVVDEAELLTLAVRPQLRRRGAGAALVEAVAAHAAAGGVRRLMLEVAVDNAAALALYARSGFAQVGVRAAYYRRSEGSADALVLARDLNSPAA